MLIDKFRSSISSQSVNDAVKQHISTLKAILDRKYKK
jgi:hypothetical protein